MPFSTQCYQCHKDITKSKPSKNGKYFCSHSCYSQFYQSSRPVLICEHCHQQFNRPPSRAKRGERFCSRTCYEAAREPEMVTKVCPVCSQSFTVKASHADRYTVCSAACRTTNTNYAACKGCGKVFCAKTNLSRRHCSEECRNPAYTRECPKCGTLFRTEPKNPLRFCSGECYRQYRGETSLEKTVRGALEGLDISYIREARMGSYWVDFILPDLRVALEADGDYWHNNRARDKRKDQYLHSQGWAVCRIPESDVNNSKDVRQLVLDRLKTATTLPLPSSPPTP